MFYNLGQLCNQTEFFSFEYEYESKQSLKYDFYEYLQGEHAFILIEF